MATKFQYVKNISEDNKSAVMSIKSVIGNSYNDEGELTETGVNGEAFANEMRFLKQGMGVQDITVEINSIGGSVMDGYNIFNAIKTHKANTHIMGLAASMAGICAVAGATRTAVDYATIMCHPVSGGADADAKVMGIFDDSVRQMLLGSTKMNGDTVNDVMSKETYFSNSAKADFTLEDAITMGLIDKIESTGVKSGISNKKKLNLSNLAKIYNELTNKPDQMKKIIDALGLDGDSTMEDVVSHLENAKKSKKEKEEELKAMKEKVAKLENELKDMKDAVDEEVENKAVALVDKAIACKKISNDDKAKYVALAKVDFDSISNLLALSTAVEAKKPVKIFNAAGNGNVKDDSRTDWDFKKWSREDPKELMNIQSGNSEKYSHINYTELYNSFYKK